MKGVSIRLLWFAFGISIGVLGAQYSRIFLRAETPVSAEQTFLDTNINDLISIRGQTDAVTRRSELIRFIWGPQGIPVSLPNGIDTSVEDKRYSGLGNLKEISKLTILMEWGLSSTGYHFIPTQGNNKLVIYHHGHEGDFIGGINTIRFFLEKGFSVIGLSMPLEPPNNQPTIDLERVGRIKLTFHDQLRLLTMKSGHPVQLFMTPVAVSLNYAVRFGYDSVYMTGVSGGGWTTTMYAALDPRIIRSYPVAGSLPIHLRSERKLSNTAHRSPDWGDYEQTIPELHSIANYPELYVLGSYGDRRKQLQVLNKYDPCCFAGDAYTTYENVVKERVQMLGAGTFAIYLDTSHKMHEISDQALTVILDDINTLDLRSQK